MKNFFRFFSGQYFTAASVVGKLTGQALTSRKLNSERCFHGRAFVNTLLIAALILQIAAFGFPTTPVDAAKKSSDKLPSSPSAAYTAGDLAVLQAAAGTTNTTASIVELNPSMLNSTAVQTLAVPDGATNANGLRFSGSATSTGYLATTNDGSLLSFTGANSNNATANVNTLNPRGVGTFNSAGVYNLATTYTGTGGNQTRSATSLDNAAYYIADQGGLYINNATAASPSGNFRAVKSFGGSVYLGQASSTSTAIQVGTISAATGGTFTGLPGLTNNANHQDFHLISSGDNGAAFDVLYTISATSNTAGTIAKFSLVGGNWTANGTYPTTFGGFGIAAADNGSGAQLYVSTGAGALTANNVVRLSDNAGYNSAISITTAGNLVLYTAPAGNIIKGVAFAPQAAAAAPEINVTGNGNTILDGDTTPSAADFTDFGNVVLGSSFDRIYTIQNLGTADLTGGNVTFTGTNAGDFTLLIAPSFPVSPGGSTSLTVRFTPGAAGLRVGTINIANNDSDENPYDFAVQGTGLTSATPTITENTASPLINLPAGGNGFLSGVVGDSTDPGQTSGIDFTIDDSDTPVASLTVTATGSNQAVVPTANLNLTGSGSARNLKITPAGVGYSTITVTVSDGGSSADYVINYAASVPSNPNASTHWHTGKSDASSAIAVDANYMFVADDEDQGLRLYNRNLSGLPLSIFDFTANLALTDMSGGVPREVDLEASAQTGNRIYWLGSHSNSSSGSSRPNRSRLFATDISGTGSTAALTYIGRYDNLKTDLINWDSSNAHGLGANYFGLAASAATNVIPEAPDGSGFNIEGLVFAPDNATAYVSFRAPVVPANNRTKALIVPVTNFASLVTGNPSAGPAVFGNPIQLNLGGRGIREIKKNSSNEYLIVAGSVDGTKNFALYAWTGNAADAPILRSASLTGLNPEAVVDLPVGLNGSAPVDVQLISDNGDDVYYNDGTAAKDLANNQLKKFRSDTVTVNFGTTAAGVTAAGRILSYDGRGIANARITATDVSTGATRTVITNSFGNFVISELPAGATFIFEVRSKRYLFSPQVIALTGNSEQLNFTAAP